MQALSFLFLLLLSVSACAADALQTALQLYQAGSPRLALARVVRDQPSLPDQAVWYDWESLRLTLLSETQQAAEILARTKLYPGNAPRDFLQKALGHAAWANLELNQNVAARAVLARLIWQFDLNPDDQKWARRLVIRAYLRDHKPDEAYRAMLRFQQDFQPLPQEVSTEFVQGLLSEQHVTEATTWLTQLDAASPTLLALQMKSGLIAPDAALLQARTALQKNQNTSDYAAIVADAAALLKDDRQQIAALEQCFNISATAAVSVTQLQQLWQAYQREAERLGNQAQVLRGDDAAWLALAARNGDDRLGARALYAYITQHGANVEMREQARAQLYAALASAQLEGAAVLIFDAAPWSAQHLSDAEIARLLEQSTSGMPDAATRALYFTAGRLQEVRKNALLAADYFAQSVLRSDLRAPDALALRAVQHVRDDLEQSGYKDDADLFYRRVTAQIVAAKKAAPKKPVPSKAKRKK